MMVDEFVERARLAEEKNDISFVIKGNRLKRKSDVSVALRFLSPFEILL